MNRLRITGGAVLGIVAALVLVTALIFAVGGVSWLTAPFRGSVQARNQIQSGSFRIAAYDTFFNQCTGIQADEARIAALKAELAGPPAPSPERAGEIQAFLTATTAQRATDIAQYNNDAAKSYTIGQFRSSKLPYRIDPTQGVTTCTLP